MSQQQHAQKLVSLLTSDAAQVDYIDNNDSIKINVTIDPSNSGVLIGHHGETVDALQLIMSLMVNHGSDQYRPVEVDVNGYRASRERNLEELAVKAAENAVQSGREIILPPLNSRERRLIHMYLSNRDDVTTYSEGEGPARRLVVRPNLA